ncbi:bacteriohemerythrin [Magnetospira sp. QH-2]|uniref:bacteriohemerythrin n=1 Tax=Magnetospira sp. (strain QH-2) TaxID=1288970 RepID=UPI0003E80AEA|nr:bacteriohemerythrin [Magnetospira sp. QH-2]CCQ74737.1 putative bacteriohemerythrin [Magnetospira sp. QH-2]
MAMIVWNDKMSVGVETLDNDHKILIDLLNRVHSVAGEGGGGDQGVLAKTLDELLDYVRYHFEAEERLMKLADYPNIEAHQELHKTMGAKVAEKHAELVESGLDEKGSLELMNFLSDWLIRHILREDMKYKPYLAGES